MGLTNFRNKLITDFINFLLINIEEEYIKLKWHEEARDSFLYKYLHFSINYIKGQINLENPKLIAKIVPMTKTEINILNADLNKYLLFKEIFENLTFIFNIMKNKQLQIELFDFLMEQQTLKDVQSVPAIFRWKKISWPITLFTIHSKRKISTFASNYEKRSTY